MGKSTSANHRLLLSISWILSHFIFSVLFVTTLLLPTSNSVVVGALDSVSSSSLPSSSQIGISNDGHNQGQGFIPGHYGNDNLHPMSVSMSTGESTPPHAAYQHHFQSQPTCEPIKISLCAGLGYNETVMPNRVGHDAQIDADALLQTFTPLIQYGCSAQLKLFLCSAFVPMCTDKVPEPIGPCQDFCLSVRSKCEPVLTEFGFPWPASLECSQFHPQNNHEHMCIPGQEPTKNQNQQQNHRQSHPLPHDIHDPHLNSDNHNPYSPPNSFSKVGAKTIPFLNPLSSGSGAAGGPFSRFMNPLNHDINLDHVEDKTSLAFPPPMAHDVVISRVPLSGSGSGSSSVSDSSGSSSCGRKVGSRGECWIRCDSGSGSEGVNRGDDGGLFLHEEEILVRNVLVTASFITIIGSSLAVLLAVTVARRRSSPSERPILYIAFCQILYSLGVIIGSWSGSHSCMEDKYTGLSLLAKGPLVPQSCSLLFLLTFFFWFSSCLWWLLLCLSWFLSFYKNHSSLLETRECASFHLVTWPLASILTSVLLINRHMEGDELTGLCGVGYQTSSLLLYYEMIPLTILVSIGVLLLLFGVSISLHNKKKMRRFDNNLYHSVSIPNHHHQSQNPRLSKKKQESKRAWKRVLYFSLVQLIPFLCQLGIVSYELGSSNPNSRNPHLSDDLKSKSVTSLVLVLMVKHVMKLLSGLLCLVWVLWLYSGQFKCGQLFPKLTTCQNQSQNGSQSPGQSQIQGQGSGSGIFRFGFLSRTLSSSVSNTSNANGGNINVGNGNANGNSGPVLGRSLPPVPVALPVAIPVPIPVICTGSSLASASEVDGHGHGHGLHSHGLGHGHGHGNSHSHSHNHSHNHNHNVNGNGNSNNGMDKSILCGLRTETWRRGETIV